MKLFPLITAVIVSAFLYALVFEREALLAFAQSAPQTDETPLLDDSIERVSVVVLKSTAKPLDSAVLVRGRTEAARSVDVKAETSGLVISEPLRKGAFVEEGTLMCELDPGTRASRVAEAKARLAEAKANLPSAEARLPEAESRLKEAEARLIEAQINENAAQKLKTGGFASDTRVATAEANVEAALAAIVSAQAGIRASEGGVESAQAAIESAEASLATAQEDVARLKLRAPFSGILESDTAELGALLQPGASCATVIQLDPINLVGFVPETQVARVKTGAPAGARLTTGQEVVGNVTFLSRSADPLTRTFRVEVKIPNPNLEIRDGQTVELVIQSDGKQAHLLPGSALTLNDEGTLGVRVAEDGVAVFQPVNLIRDTIQGVWVDGLGATSEVIIVGQEYVTNGVAVDVTYEEETQG